MRFLRRRTAIEYRLRHERPMPSQELLQSITQQVAPPRRLHVGRRLLAAGLVATVLGVVAAAGGYGDVANATHSAYQAITMTHVHTTVQKANDHWKKTDEYKKGFEEYRHKKKSSADDQYKPPGYTLVCHHNPAWNPDGYGYVVDNSNLQSFLSARPNDTIGACTHANHAADSSFEDQPDPYYHWGPGTFSWVDNVAHTGSHSLEVSSTSGGLSRWLSNTTSLQAFPGQRYHGSVWVKTQDVAGNANITLTFWNSHGNYIGGSAAGSSDVGGTNGFTQLSVTTTAPAGTAFVRLEFRQDGTGTSWFDDAELYGLEN